MNDAKEDSGEPEYKYFECGCSSYEHPLKLTYFPKYKKEPTELFICFSTKNYKFFWKRLVEGLRYIFNKRSIDYGEFVLVDCKVRDEIVAFLNKL